MVIENIIISNEKELKKKIKEISNGGVSKLHIISDFDRTLTKAFVNGKKVRAIITQLYEGNALTSDYRKKAQKLHDKYYPIEVNPKIPMKEKKKKMEEWWRTHKKLLIDSRLNLKDIQEVVDKGYLEFRKGALDFFDLTYKKQIPLVIFSASGLGEAIPLYFKKVNKDYKNIHIISNSMEYDENGNAISIIEPVIHVFNKGEIALKGLPIMNQLKTRKNIILLGDSLGDINMTEGFNYEKIIKIGFLNYQDEEDLNDYKKVYDVVILNDGTMDYVNGLLKKII